MVEYLIEYLFWVVDLFMYLFFYHKLMEEPKNIQKVLLYSFSVGLIFFGIEKSGFLRDVFALRDSFLFFIGLVVYSWNFSKNSIFSILVVNMIFSLGLCSWMTVTKIAFAPVDKIFIFGTYRTVFVVLLKLFEFFFTYYFVEKIRQLRLSLDSKVLLLIGMTALLSEIIINEIISISALGYEMNLIMIILLCVIILFLVLLINYMVSIKHLMELRTTGQLMEIIEPQVLELMDEHKNIYSMIHDVKNNILDIQDSVQKNDMNSANEKINRWLYKYHEVNSVPFCSNLYVDALIKRKMLQHQEYSFDLKLIVPENIPMSVKDLLILVMCVLDIGCKKDVIDPSNVVELEIKANRNEISIYERFVTYQNLNDNPQMEIICGLVKKYHGDIKFDEKEMKLILFLDENVEKESTKQCI